MLGCAQQEIEAHLRGVTREQHTTTAIDSTKSQTHSATTVGLGFFTPNGSAVWPRHPRKLRAHRHQSGGMTPSKAPTRRRRADRGLRMAQNPHRSHLKCTASPTRPGRSASRRENTRPARPLQRLFREKTRPASTKTPNFGCFERAGRTFSRFRDDTAPRGELFRAHMKPPPPLLAPSRVRMKPATPLLAHNATKTHISGEQR